MMKINASLWQTYSNVKFDLQHKITFESYAIITAWNPESDKLSQYENCVNNQHLQNELISYDWYSVRVGDPDFYWFEESFAVNMPLEKALKLGRAYRQNAIYYVCNDILYLHSCKGEQQECLGDFNLFKV
ncbi:DUF3293 domain-containing protein [Vibrio ziniensis]|uniref:DUF3293 domain-containing protein n=1 Tax=Vibrio ziniensis TaxID=2711221 RepID=A0A6G7CKH3_9VIBR|nr:DUF3293 domain-containing protein [Vibrio ziniensis]QIH42631.1 DUF3293 domain-containing protein [Vibrio ziniensis]